jgi:hypothetical protein
LFDRAKDLLDSANVREPQNLPAVLGVVIATREAQAQVA